MVEQCRHCHGRGFHSVERGSSLTYTCEDCAVALTVSTIRNRDRALRLFEEIEKSKARRAATRNGEKVDE